MREGWVRKSISEICDKASSNIAQNKIADIDGDYPVYGASGYVQNVDFYHRDTDYIGIVKDGSGVGRVNVYPAYSSLLGTMQYIIPKDGYLLRYVAYALKGLNLSSFASGAAIPHIYFKDYGKCKIDVPPLSEQQRIVSELDLLSSIIEKKKAQLKEYDQLAQSIFYDMFGDPVTNEKGWEVKKLGEVCEYAKTRIRSEAITTNNYVGVDNLLQNCQGKTIATKVPDSLGLTEYWKGDVLIVNIRQYLKKNWLSNEKGGCNGDVLAIRRQEVYRENINTMFLFKCLSTERFFDFAMQYAKGEKMPRGDKKEIMKYPIPLPPLSLQQSFASKIEAIEHQKALVQQSITETESLFNSRMDYYFD